MQWRPMTADERAVLPEARLGGALLWMVIGGTIAFVVPVLGMGLAILVLSTGGVHANPGNVFSWLDGPFRMGKVYMIPVAFFMLWSLVYVVMTLCRLRATPVVAGAGIVLWVVLRVVLDFIGQAPEVAAAERTTLPDALVRIWPYAIAVLAELVLAAGFCGYMATGVRPNAYYRGRLPTA